MCGCVCVCGCVFGVGVGVWMIPLPLNIGCLQTAKPVSAKVQSELLSAIETEDDERLGEVSFPLLWVASPSPTLPSVIIKSAFPTYISSFIHAQLKEGVVLSKQALSAIKRNIVFAERKGDTTVRGEIMNPWRDKYIPYVLLPTNS